MTATLWCYAGIYMENTCLSNGSWTSDENCPNVLQDVRLVDGVGLYDGRIEVLYNGTWGTICRNNYRYQNSVVICRMLGASRQEETTRFGAGSGPIHFENLYCQGSETDLSQCTVDVEHTCSHSLDAGVICYKYRRPLNITGVRLADGTSKYDGRVELEENGVWGLVCPQYFDFNDGNTLCRMMNMSLLKYFTGSKHGPGNGPVMFDHIGCSSYHNHIKDCTYYTPLKYCYSTDTVSLLCSECGPVNEYGTASYSENGTLATITCSYDHYTKDPIVECINGSWSKLGVCDFHGPPLNITSVRLVDGVNEYEGRVEIEVNGTYGTICDSLFDLNDAETICRTINSSWGSIYFFTRSKYGEGAGPIYIQRLFCDSTSNLLEHCIYHSLGVCDHSRDVGIVCSECAQPSVSRWGIGYFTYNDSALYADCSYYKTYLGTLKMTCDQKTKKWITEGECQQYSSPLEIQDMRLANGQSEREGRVEIKVFDTWGTICENGFGLAEANVICHMIGFPPAQAAYGVDAYGQGTGPIFVDDLSCGQFDTHINNCTYVTYDDCTHLQDVAVKCTECDDPRPMNGSINGTVFKFKSVVEVVCEYGYFLQGERLITCQSDATWSARPECRLIDCGDPLPADGYINGTDFTLGTNIEVICDEGYNISGDSIISCQENRSWSDNTTCSIIDCGELYVENADLDNSNSTTFGKISLVSCFDGYLPSGATPVECLASGAWGETPFCDRRNCSDPTPYRGQRNDTKTSYGTVVLITCDDGLNVAGNAVIVCQANGTWSDRPLCDTSDCGPPVKANGQYMGNTTTGSSATVMCDEGHDLLGPSVVFCDVQGWNESVRCIRQDCGILSVEDGIVVLNEGTLFGDSAEISCSTGYELNGDARVTCLDGRDWSDYPNCTIIDCGEIDHPTNGALIVPVAFTYGANVSFQCNDGFILSGESFIVCGISGSWNADPPECVPKSPIHGPCENVNYCLTPNAYCVNGACSCQTGIYDERTDSCDRMPLFPFDSDEPENVLVSTTCSSAITFTPGIPVFKRMRYSLFVCSSGLISFDRAYNNPVPPKKKKTDELADFSVIAPYFAEIDLRRSESVTFRKTDVLNDYPYSELQLSDIERAKDIIRKIEGIATFEPKFLLVTHWKRMIPKQRTFIETSVSSFQLVLVSDGLSTYFINIYPKDLMQWQTVPISRSYGNSNQPVAVWIGYSDDGRVSPQSKSFKEDALRMDIKSKSIISTPNNRYLAVDGMLMKPLTIPGDWQTHDALDCIHWYNQHVENKDNYHHIMASAMPPCPCDLTLARFDPWFWRIRRSLRWPWWQSNTDVDHNDIICVDMWHRPYFDPYGKSCCYKRSTSKFVEITPNSGGFHHYHPAFSPQNHYLYDTFMKDKCCTKSEFCDLYYQLHPVGTCYSRSPYRQGNFWGDPHISTLDRYNFTFNGLGEYTLLLIETDYEWFTLQARTQRAVKFDGNLTDATFFSAFAATDRVNASMHVELNSEKNGFVIFGNQIDLTTQYTAAQDNFEFDSSSLSISENNNSLRVTFKESGILIDIGLGVQMLSLSTIVPSRFANNTRGLLGNFDGDPFNDLMFTNGTILNPSSNEREIFHYGQNWALTEDSTEFFYEDGTGHSDFTNASYVPRFLFEIDNITMSLAIEACGETSSPECIFDFAATLNPELALDTGNKKNVVDQDQKEIEEVMPVVEGCGVVNTTVGQTVSCELTLDEDLDIEFLGNETFDAAFDRNRSTITYTQSRNMTSALRYQAVNQGGRTSVEYAISVLLCTGCSGHGYCTTAIRSETRNIYLRNNECTCHTGYDGPNCENDYDGCAGNPCSLGRECTDLSPQEQETQGRGFVCGACPEGYTTTEGVDACLDIDECSTNDTCEQFCLNTEGSFTCLCGNGYRPDSSNDSKCQDINECEEELHNCTHVCNNTYGAFKCDCRAGYELDVTTQLCTKGLWDPCRSTDLDCRNTSGCTLDANDNPTCFCGTGFELNATGKECIDINECERNVCSQECTNFIGGFQCSCIDGYMLEGVSTCTECEDSYWGHKCNNTCDCNDRGTVECSPYRGCVCEPGWSGSACDDDVNECVVEQNICADVLKLCTNAVGSYSCHCIDGFQKDQTGSCIDANECDNPSLNNCSHDCSNTIGSYSCSCRPGYKLMNSLCQDINECTLGLATCEQMCENKPGTYNCYCHFGYKLNDDRRTCTKVSDPCKTLSNLTCSGYCVVNNNITECRCQHGFVLGEDDQRCFDVDECQGSTTNMCDPVSRCINTEGSYVCECPVGTRLENDGRTCSECDEYHFGRNCLQECNCIKGVCNSTLGCVCDDGWTGPNCDVDEDECDLQAFTCTMPNMHCVNLPGTASCQCLAGYHTDQTSGGCIDFNECLDVLTHDCAQICTNTNGSYECSCRAGFNQNGKQCTDIDECQGLRGCEQKCENTLGSYRCSCSEGYKLDLLDRHSCMPETECNTDQYSTCPQNSTCVVASGDVMCKCPKGYSNTSTHVCADVNECVDNKHNCMQMCSNIDGGYDCLCRSGFYLLSDGVSCGECRPWRYGSNCDSSCSCLKDSSISCNKTSGECECKPGWTGENCAQNIDECSLGTFQLCPNNSQCVDTSGSFVCKCNTGFSKNGYGKCEECQHGRFGAGCGHTCGCYMHHTERCDYVTGHCTCDKGWRGVTCEEDDNECNDTNACPRNSDCVNTMGSFECNCHIGFKKRRALGEECIKCYDFTYGGNCNEVCTCTEEHSTGCDSINGSCFCMQGWQGETCSEDVDECRDPSLCDSKANNHCVNLIGSYECLCNAGYSVHNGDCKDVNECLTENLSACDKRARCKNTDGSYTCECPAGTNLHDVGRSCIDCEDNYFGYNCSNICDCTHGSCNKTSGCHCNDGWTGPQCNIDVNECDLGLLECEEPNAICNNTKGSADCVCKAGYKRNQTSGQCEDIEECKDDAFNTCGHICSNTPGRYVCSCYDGYRYVSANNTCADVNECATSILNQCDHKCDNNEGGYLCECDQGFSLDAADNKRCIPITECSEEDVTACPAFSVCYRNETELDCRCNNGYAKNSTGFCTDMDECEEERNPCDQQCNNTEGGFICSCERGFKLVHNTQCDECDTFTFGSNCASPCTCEQSNAESCDPVNGTCTCSVGWMGENCTQDLNECEKEIFDCPEHSHCDNTVGSHTCQCNIGYINIQGGSCEMCGAFRYGDSCAEQCPCSSTTAEACDHVSGNCTCKSNWQGTHCDKDVDECSFSGNVCSEKIHSSCSNTAGSFICTCDSGFSDLNGICEDIDECQNSPCDEGVTCENTEGSFRCLCPQGKKLLNETSCQDCNNNTFGNGCNGQCNCTQENSETADQSCDTVTGSCLCNPHWTGRFCEMDVNECVTSGICTEANTGCRNIHGGFLCDCLRGFTINSETGHCEYVLPSTSELPEDEISVNLTLSLGVELAPGTDLAVQTVFDKIAEKVEKSIRKHFSKYISVQFTILINDLSVGSVNVKYTIIFKKNSDAAIDIFKAVMDIGSVTEIEYEGRNVTALSTESYSSDKTCEFYETKLGGCGSGFECISNAGEPTCREMSDTDNYTLVVGVAVGLSVFLVTVFVTLTAIVVYNRNRKEHLKNLRGGESISSFDKQKSQYWPPWRKGNDKESRYSNWMSLALRFGKENQFDTPYHLPRAHTDHGSNEGGAQY
ncbi:uncharacterized protein LOC128211759 isoform X2 [Mya arenaria]|nr:uncharacterized protein LOC128211759 isoform X2 [Mya arenaria]